MQLVINAACKAVSPEGLCRTKIVKLNPTATATGTESPEICADADPIATATESLTQGCLGVEALSGLALQFIWRTQKNSSYVHLGLCVYSGFLSRFLLGLDADTSTSPARNTCCIIL